MPTAPIDVDFTQDKRYVPGFNGFGESVNKLRNFSDVTDMIPESQWRPIFEERKARGLSARSLVTRIFDQGQEGSCVANQCAQAHEMLQAKELGKDRVTLLSPISLYKRIGSSAGSGAYIGDAMDESMETGILPLDTPENRARFGDKVMPHRGFREPYPDDWKPTAGLFKFDEAFIGRGLTEMMTALAKLWLVGVGRAGHSILYPEYEYEDDGDLFAPYPNSWTTGWGDEGWGKDSRRMMQSASGMFIVYRSTNTIAE
jgi:hypothetical protein